MPSDQHEHYMRIALREAMKGAGLTSPNPAVGAVLVAGDRVVSRAFHRGPGQPHAEIACLERVVPNVAAKATLYVTLEPCSTIGRTGRCTDAIISAKIPRVVTGAIDVNPEHNGRGLELLSGAGVEVTQGVLAEDCAAINEAFNKWIVTRRPFIIAKCGMTLDGRLTRPPNESRLITSAKSRQDAQQLRSQVDAVLIGAETLRQDDPKLTVRGARGARQPLRVVMTRSGRLPRDSRMLRDGGRTAIYRGKSLQQVLVDLGQKQITSVLIEGGGDILGQALDARLIDKIQIYIAPLFAGGPVVAFAGRGAANTAEALKLQRVTYRTIGNDLCVTGYPLPEKVPRSNAPRKDSRASLPSVTPAAFAPSAKSA